MVHVYPIRDDRHVLNGTDCWCQPEVQWLDPETREPFSDGPVVIHNAPDGYDERGETPQADKSCRNET